MLVGNFHRRKIDPPIGQRILVVEKTEAEFTFDGVQGRFQGEVIDLNLDAFGEFGRNLIRIVFDGPANRPKLGGVLRSCDLHHRLSIRVL